MAKSLNQLRYDCADLADAVSAASHIELDVITRRDAYAGELARATENRAALQDELFAARAALNEAEKRLP